MRKGWGERDEVFFSSSTLCDEKETGLKKKNTFYFFRFVSLFIVSICERARDGVQGAGEGETRGRDGCHRGAGPVGQQQ